MAIHQYWESMLYSSVTVAADLLPLYFFNIGAGLIEEFGDKVVGIDVELDAESSSSLSMTEKIELKNAKKIQSLKTCIQTHKKIKKFVKKTEKIFEFIILVQGLVSTIILCTTAYTISQVTFSLTASSVNFYVLPSRLHHRMKNLVSKLPT